MLTITQAQEKLKAMADDLADIGTGIVNDDVALVILDETIEQLTDLAGHLANMNRRSRPPVEAPRITDGQKPLFKTKKRKSK